MDEIQFQERWNNALAYKNDLFKKLFYKKPLENGELRLERQQKQQRANYYKQQRLKHKRTKEEQQERNRQSAHKYFQERKDNEEYKALKRAYAKRYYEKHKNDIVYLEKRRQWQRESYAKDPKKKIRKTQKYYQEHKDYYRAYYQRKRQEKLSLLLENDEPRRAKEELARFTPEERRAFDEWERQNKEHTVY